MHCPNCGNESSLDQKFCRKCGFSLEPVSKLVVKGSGPDELEVDKAERERVIVRHMFRWLTWGLLVMGLATLMLVANKSFDFGKVFNLVTSAIMLAGVGMALYGVISAVGKAGPSVLKGRDVTRQEEIRSATTKELAGDGVPIPLPSVTERTTQLIVSDVEESCREP